MNIHRTQKVLASLALAGFVVAGAFSPSVASACSCMIPLPPMEALGQSDAVFVGTVIDITSGQRVYGNTVTLEADISWKGNVGKTVKIVTAQDSAACGVYFQVGKTYVVYAHQNTEDGSLGANSCSRTHEITGSMESDEDVLALGLGTPIANGTSSAGVSNQNISTMLLMGILGIAGGFAAFKLRSGKA